MVDSKYVVLVKVFRHLLVQIARRAQVAPEGLFDYDPRPSVLGRVVTPPGKTGFAELLQDRRKLRWWSSKVKQPPPIHRSFPVTRCEHIREPLITFSVVITVIGGEVKEP